jgi:acyl-CoA thioesterase
MNENLIEKFREDSYASHLEINIVDVSEGYAKVEAVVKEDFLNFNGVCHGGFIFTLADVAFSMASNSHNQQAYAINVSINFMKGAQVGDHLVAEARETKLSGPLGFYEMKVWKGDELIAECQAIVYRKREPVI